MDYLKSKTTLPARAVNDIDPSPASELEHKTRREHKFDEIEQSLPDIKIPKIEQDAGSMATSLLSHLGMWLRVMRYFGRVAKLNMTKIHVHYGLSKHRMMEDFRSLNPLPKELTENDTLWLFDNTAFRSPLTGNWQAEFVASYWHKSSDVDVEKAVADIAEKVGVGSGDTAEATIAKRLGPFVWEIEPGREVTVDLGEGSEVTLGPGSRNGISSDVKSIPGKPAGTISETQAEVPDGADGILGMKTFYAETEGWGVISDIDDTIKLTQTSSPIGILTTTFVSDPTPITGMPELYSKISALVGPAAPFFYLSASPYNLYGFLKGFRDQFYPQGTIILRDASWMNLSGLLSNLTLGTQSYKVERMKKINSWLPGRKFIAIGDSTQSDPEAYGQIYRTYPGWIQLILIRRVTSIAEVGILEKNDPERFEKAFKGVPATAWHVFEDPAECEALIDNAIGQE